MNKNRDLPITDYLDILQHEYIVAEIRHKIYQKISDKKYWGKVMNGKRKKIEDICFRNKIQNIFNDEEEKKRLYSEIYPDSGLPKFIYKDDEQKYGNGDFPGLERTDIDYYYSAEAPVRVIKDNKTVIGKIGGYTEERDFILVDVDGVEEAFERNEVTRIL